MFFGGHDEQDVTQVNPGGNAYSTDGQGEERGVWGGKSASWSRDGDGNVIRHLSGRGEDVNRYRQLAAGSDGRVAPRLSYGRANASLDASNQGLGAAYNAMNNGVQRAHENQQLARGQQSQALGLQMDAARGNAPSRAELLGRGLIDQSLQSQLAGAASARGGPLAQMSAQRNAQQGAAGFQQQGMNQLSALRADEMERARAAAMSGATSIRGQDFAGGNMALGLGQGIAGLSGQHTANAGTSAQMSQSQGQMDFNQRQLNQNNRQFYERLGWDTNKAAADLGHQRSQMEMDNYWSGVNKERQDHAQTMKDVGTYAGVVSDTGGFVYDAAKDDDQNSDMRTKKPAPLLLDVAGRKPSAAAPNWLDRFMSPERAEREAARNHQEHDERMEEVDGSKLQRDNPYDGPTPGGIQRTDPYGGIYNPRTGETDDSQNEVFFSDERAKKEAEAIGFAKGQAAVHQQQADSRMESAKSFGGAALLSPAHALGAGIQAGRSMNAQRQADAKPAEPTKAAPEPRKPNVPESSRKSLIIQHGSEATKKDMLHQGVPVTQPQSSTYGDREMERGKSVPIPPQPKPKEKGDSKWGTGDRFTQAPQEVQQDANRRGAGMLYAYKDQYVPRDQKPGQLNYGPSANELEQNPLTATAVHRGPDGMRQVNVPLLVKNNTAGIASLQEQLDEMKGRGLRYG